MQLELVLPNLGLGLWPCWGWFENIILTSAAACRFQVVRLYVYSWTDFLKLQQNLKSCHPDIVYRDYEPTAFSPNNDYHPKYDSSFPNKAPDEFLIDKSGRIVHFLVRASVPTWNSQAVKVRYFPWKSKTVMYAGSNRTVINGKAAAMKKMNPNLKIFAFMTDPVSRLFSHLNMCIRSKWKFCKHQTLEQVRFGVFHRQVGSTTYYYCIAVTNTIILRLWIRLQIISQITILQNLLKPTRWSLVHFIDSFNLEIMLW